jgi:hypothetical protein
MKPQVFALSVGLAWLFIPQVTTAQSQGTEDADSAKAAVRFQLAVELYREGGYEGALAEFRKAYQISPSYRVLYNIAQTQYALHDFVGAYKSLTQYMSEGSGEIPAERRAQVEEMSAKLVERIAHLQIVTNVMDADIRIDDFSVGTSPLAAPVPVNAGTRRVSASKAGFPDAIRMVTVAGKERVKVELQIDEPTTRAAVVAPSVVSRSAPLIVKTQTQAAPSRTGLIVSLSTTAALAIGTGAFGYLALSAQKDLKDQISIYPNTKDKIEDARNKSKTYGYVTDALGAATLISGGVALYYVIFRRGDSPKPKSEKARKTIVLVPSVGGMVLQGSF